MIEHVHHALGTCGESHPNIWTIVFGSLGLTAFTVWVRYQWNRFISIFKKG